MNKPDGRHTKLDLTEQEGKESLSKAPNIKCCSAKIHQHPVHAETEISWSETLLND